MPWSTPTLKDVRRMTRDYVLSQLGAKAMVPNSVLRIMSDSMSGLAHLTLLYIDWLSKQLLPDTAEKEWLDRHGVIWLTNADGSKGRKAASYARGTVEFIGADGTIIPVGTVLKGANGVEYQSVTQGEIASTGDATADVAALTAGAVGNLPNGEALTVELSGVESASTHGDLTGGANEETDDQLRERILFRIQNPPMGGSEADYERWALSVPGVTRAWAKMEQGPGTITTRFLMDDLRASDDGWPTPSDVQTVHVYIDKMRPVTVMGNYVVAPIKQFIDIEIAELKPSTMEVAGAIEQSVRDMLYDVAAPGETIYSAWISYAIMKATGVQSFRLVTTDDYVMPSLGHMAVLGTILYDIPPGS
jgi:uncharacterized phage protein gp47/JayE